MDALELLKADHNRVRGLFTRFKGADETDDTATMQALAAKILDELRIHMTIEEEIFYPAVSGRSEEIGETVYEAVEEHHVAKVLVDELADLEPGDAEVWKAKVKVLIEAVEHHADEEESDMFPPVRAKTTAEQRAALGSRLEARKVELGAPAVEVALDLSMEELKAKAREQAIPGRSYMNKDTLAATIDPTA